MTTSDESGLSQLATKLSGLRQKWFSGSLTSQKFAEQVDELLFPLSHRPDKEDDDVYCILEAASEKYRQSRKSLEWVRGKIQRTSFVGEASEFRDDVRVIAVDEVFALLDAAQKEEAKPAGEHSLSMVGIVHHSKSQNQSVIFFDGTLTSSCDPIIKFLKDHGERLNRKKVVVTIRELQPESVQGKTETEPDLRAAYSATAEDMTRMLD